ncbi:MAG: polyamine ABC transporter substrate-binding protein [Thiolinea sp.]
MKVKVNLFGRVTVAAALSVALCGAVPAVHAEEKVLNVYNWSDYIDETVIADFEEKTGIKINYDVFDSNEILETKLLAGSSGYDLVVPSAHFLSRQIKAGVFQPLDKEKLPNLKNAWDVILERTAIYDEGNAHSVNYLWGTTGIGYVEEKVKEVLGEDAPLDSWDLVFKPEYAEKLAKCGIHWLDAPTEMIPAMEKYLGLDPAKTDADALAKVEELALKVRPYIQKFHSSEYIGALANGDICVAIGWSGDVFQAQSRAEENETGMTVNYVIPKEAAQMWFDMLTIPVDAKHVDEAHQFINYLLEPEVIAKISNYVAYANGNKASQEFIDKEILENPAIYPTPEVMERLFTTKAYEGKLQRLVTRTWTKIKSGQ